MSQPAALDILASDPVPCIVDNAPLLTGATYDLVDPHAGGLLYRVSAAKAEHARAAVDSAARALPAWKATEPATRRAIFLKLADLLRARHGELTAAQVKETVSSFALAAFDVAMSAGIPDELAALASALRDEIAPAPNGQLAIVTHEPYGVVLACAPWNGPCTLGLRAVANPLMAGNTVVLKTSEYSPKAHAVLGELFAAAGLPPGVLNIVHVDPADAPTVVHELIAHPAIRKVNFTGSTRVGALLAETCGKHLKPIMLELGGACPFIVLPDADVARAVNAVVFSGLFHSGQICMSVNAALVHSSLAPKFVELLAAHLPKLRAAPDSPVLRGLFNGGCVARVRGLVDDALAKGAKVVAGTYESQGNLMQPVVLGGVTRDMRIFNEEIFGPVFSVLTYETEDEAVELANAVQYGLSSAIWTSDVMKGMTLAKRINHGAVHINGTTVDDAQTRPHGGVGHSGWGRFNGIHGLREFSQTKIVTVNQPTTFPL